MKKNIFEELRDQDKKQRWDDMSGESSDNNSQNAKNNNEEGIRRSNQQQSPDNDAVQDNVEGQEDGTTQKKYVFESLTAEKMINEIKETQGKIFLNIFNVDNQAKYQDIYNYYFNVRIDKIIKNSHKQGNFDLEFSSQDEAIKCVNRGTGRINNRMFFIRMSYRNKNQQIQDEQLQAPLNFQMVKESQDQSAQMNQEIKEIVKSNPFGSAAPVPDRLFIEDYRLKQLQQQEDQIQAQQRNEQNFRNLQLVNGFPINFNYYQQVQPNFEHQQVPQQDYAQQYYSQNKNYYSQGFQQKQNKNVFSQVNIPQTQIFKDTNSELQTLDIKKSQEIVEKKDENTKPITPLLSKNSSSDLTNPTLQSKQISGQSNNTQQSNKTESQSNKVEQKDQKNQKPIVAEKKIQPKKEQNKSQVVTQKPKVQQPQQPLKEKKYQELKKKETKISESKADDNILAKIKVPLLLIFLALVLWLFRTQ